jgi:hypothetical protein
MTHVNFRTTLAFSIALTSFSAMANPTPPPTSIGCSPKATSATLAIQAVAYTSIDDQFQPSCPLLEEKESRKLVDKFGGGTTFAHPFIPGTCLSGTVTSGTLQLDDETEITIDTTASYTESAQRLFPVPDGQGSVNLFATSDDGSLQAGAAMTAVHLESEDENYKFDVLLDDHFLLTKSGEDTEDFLIVGSRGDYKASGRLTGKGQIISVQPLGIMFEVSGTLCLE